MEDDFTVYCALDILCDEVDVFEDILRLNFPREISSAQIESPQSIDAWDGDKLAVYGCSPSPPDVHPLLTVGMQSIYDANPSSAGSQILFERSSACVNVSILDERRESLLSPPVNVAADHKPFKSMKTNTKGIQLHFDISATSGVSSTTVTSRTMKSKIHTRTSNQRKMSAKRRREALKDRWDQHRSRLPPIVKSDVRRNYFRFMERAFNSYDFSFVSDYLGTFYSKDCVYSQQIVSVSDSESTSSSELLHIDNSNAVGNRSCELHGVDSLRMYLNTIMDISSDCTIAMEDTQIIVRSDGTSTLRARAVTTETVLLTADGRLLQDTLSSFSSSPPEESNLLFTTAYSTQSAGRSNSSGFASSRAQEEDRRVHDLFHTPYRPPDDLLASIEERQLREGTRNPTKNSAKRCVRGSVDSKGSLIAGLGAGKDGVGLYHFDMDECFATGSVIGAADNNSSSSGSSAYPSAVAFPIPVAHLASAAAATAATAVPRAAGVSIGNAAARVADGGDHARAAELVVDAVSAEKTTTTAATAVITIPTAVPHSSAFLSSAVPSISTSAPPPAPPVSLSQPSPISYTAAELATTRELLASERAFLQHTMISSGLAARSSAGSRDFTNATALPMFSNSPSRPLTSSSSSSSMHAPSASTLSPHQSNTAVSKAAADTGTSRNSSGSSSSRSRCCFNSCNGDSSNSCCCGSSSNSIGGTRTGKVAVRAWRWDLHAVMSMEINPELRIRRLQCDIERGSLTLVSGGSGTDAAGAGAGQLYYVDNEMLF